MDSQKSKIVLLLLLLLCFCNISFAASNANLLINKKIINETVSNDKLSTEKVASMVASPNSCTVKVDQEVCEMTFHIIWQTPTKGNYCLHSKEGVKPLKCWYGVDHGTLKLEFFAHVLADNKHYVLLDAQGDHLIATTDVPIIGTLKQRQRAQRRRRGFWRMF